MNYIGFTNKYYTLWEVENKGRWTYYTYKQNLSFDLDKAKAKVPDAIVDLSLHGSSSFRVESVPQDCFQFGKYRGERFAECGDIEYMAWYHNTCKNDNLQKYVRPILEKSGYALFNGEMHTEDEIKWLEYAMSQFPFFEGKINNKEVFRLPLKKNLTKRIDECGIKNIGVYENIFCNLLFDEIEERAYNNHTYYIPMGCGLTSLKGRTLVVKEYDAEKVGEMKFNIKVKKYNFE